MASLYIHIPYCRRICGYCDFYHKACEDAPKEYLDALEREIHANVRFLRDETIDTVYFGGGTPSLYSPVELSRIIEVAESVWTFGGDMEITLEANPDDVSEAYAEELSASRFNRVSVGIQSFNDRALRFMNRRHDSRQAIAAVERLRKAGIGNISIDLIYGVPGTTEQEWAEDIGQALALEAEHISAYHLTFEPGTAFGIRAAKGGIRPVGEEVSEREYLMLRNRLTGSGFVHYEISNFARGDAFRSRHNSAYWSGAPYLGIGASAHSYDGQRLRRIVKPDAALYIEKAGTEAIYESELLTDENLYNEFVMVSLRTSRGIEFAELKKRFAGRYAEHFLKASKPLISNRLLTEHDGRIAVPAEKFLLSDAIIGELFYVE